RPYQKLLGQVIGASVCVLCGQRLPWTGYDLADVPLTLFWLAGITNALNLLDNMDGLAAGVAAIAAGVLSACFFTDGRVTEGFLVASFAAALLGFLVYNFSPASVFMGDCGALFIGFFLASATLIYLSGGGRSHGELEVL